MVTSVGAISAQVTLQPTPDNTEIVLVDGQPALVLMTDSDSVTEVLMYVPDYFEESSKSPEQIKEESIKAYADQTLVAVDDTRFLKYEKDQFLLDMADVSALREIAISYDKRPWSQVNILATNVGLSSDRVTNVQYMLYYFGVPEYAIRIDLVQARGDMIDQVIKVELEEKEPMYTTL